MNQTRHQIALPLICLALFGLTVALWMQFYGRSKLVLHSLLECTEHVGESGIGTDWEIFTEAAWAGESDNAAGRVRRTLKRDNKVVSQDWFEGAAIKKAHDSLGTSYAVDFRIATNPARIEFPPGDVSSTLKIGASAAPVEMRCFLLEP